jgi:O-antigen ligase
MAIAFTASLLASSTTRERAAGGRALRILLLGGLLAASVGLLGAADLLPAAITGRLGSIASDLQVIQDIRTVKVNDENFATVERVAHWWAGWRMWEDHPWTGVGIGNYATAYPIYNLAGWEDPLGHAHNFYINMGAEAGTLGLAAYLIFLGAALWQTSRSLFGATNAWQRALALGILGILIARIVQDGLDNLWVHALGVQMALLLGLLSARRRP